MAKAKFIQFITGLGNFKLLLKLSFILVPIGFAASMLWMSGINSNEMNAMGDLKIIRIAMSTEFDGGYGMQESISIEKMVEMHILPKSFLGERNGYTYKMHSFGPMWECIASPVDPGVTAKNWLRVDWKEKITASERPYVFRDLEAIYTEGRY